MHRIFLILCLLASFPAQSEDLETSHSLFDSKLTLRLPADFLIMSEEAKGKKYPAGSAPKIVYTDESTRINFAANQVPYPGPSDKLLELAQALQLQMGKIRNIVEWRAVGVKEINDVNFAYLEFVTPVLESDDYQLENRMYLRPTDGSLFIIGINCTTDLATSCSELVRIVEQSLEFAD